MWFLGLAAVLFVVAAAWSSEFFASGVRRGDAQVARASFPPVDQAMVADLAVAAIRAGCSVPALLVALESALAEEEEPPGLECVAKSLTMGGTWEEAWQDAPSRFDPLRNALEPSWVDGAAAVPLLERTAASLRAGRVRRARESAARLGAKLVLPLGLCFPPAFILRAAVPTAVSGAWRS